ncbi:PREDICTED: cGMP-dependent 3',5'-cyclic phosphodiesterase-like isoform X2 [Branchiostoma belcheri]|uniref:Phosphodiesterase n=1 Tax=Branchiostoma belcheri TaxID=7741 RepID=A0A6P4YBB3_BRABE|nr:PREDICTED: cGMP-dependent 3',5'-cyclic phosphodiesterase-like isoform X2 [Branchiostoma belcheri]
MATVAVQRLLGALRGLAGWWWGGEARETVDFHTLQDALLQLSGVIDLDGLRRAVEDAIGTIIPNVHSKAVYLLDLDSRQLRCHGNTLPVLPAEGIIQEAVSEQQCVTRPSPPAEDPVCRILQLRQGEQDRTVICFPVLDREGSDLLAILLISCSRPAQLHYDNLSLLGKHIATCYSRLKQVQIQSGGAMSHTPARRQDSGTIDTQAILQLCADLYDQDAPALQLKVIRYLQKVTRAECCLLLLVADDTAEFFCQVIGEHVLEEELRFPIDQSCLGHVVSSKKPVTLEDLDSKGKEELQSLVQHVQLGEIRSMLCIPVESKAAGNIVALACVFNKRDRLKFSSGDASQILTCFTYTSTVLTSTLAVQKERKLKLETQSMLQIAKNLFTHLDDVSVLLREIMQEARNLTHAERCSLFLVDKGRRELVAKVFDGVVADESELEKLRQELGPNHRRLSDVRVMNMNELRIPIDQGIAGHVATTGEILNIKDAYSHPLFYSGVDHSTGFRTRNILCFPIKNEGHEIVGVAELCNKINGPCFSTYDEELAQAFSIYCGISLVHSLLYKKVADAQHRSKLSNELMMYHMKVNEDETARLIVDKIPAITSIHPDVFVFSFTPRVIYDDQTTLCCLAMFEDMGMINRWRIQKETLVKFVLMVKKGYRDPPYHNWYHAFSVSHFCYLLYKNLRIDQLLTDVELFALFVACLCHDLDHRGTNNAFQVSSKSVLAALYSSEGSVLERHHFAQAMCILNTEGCNIFENLNKRDYEQALDLLQEIILATDLAHHLSAVKDLEAMAKEGYDKSNPRCHTLLTCLLMTSCDLSDQTKGWGTTKKIAELIYQEFFRQGDLEKSMGYRPHEMMDREKAFIPDLQISFLENIAMPLYRILGDLLPGSECVFQAVKANRDTWMQVRETAKRKPITHGNSFDFFKMLDEDDDNSLVNNGEGGKANH